MIAEVLRQAPPQVDIESTKELNSAFLHNTYEMKRRLFKFGATFDVVDPSDNEKIGTIRHNLSKSFPRTNWDILSPDGETVLGTLRRTKVTKAWHRYGAKALFYPSYEIVTPDENVVTSVQRKFSPTGMKFKMNVHGDNPPIDRKLLVAANIVIAEREYERNRKEHSVVAVNNS